MFYYLAQVIIYRRYLDPLQDSMLVLADDQEDAQTKVREFLSKKYSDSYIDEGAEFDIDVKELIR